MSEQLAFDGSKQDADKYCDRCNAYLGDGHDCDNCPFCGTDGGDR